jgi:DNA-directed RNA polymerase specialized sigma24 family protein
MSTTSPFAHFVRRIRAGDEQAAVELVRQYESAIRLEVRLRLRDPRLRRTFDSLDVCQSVLASFFVRAAAGQFDLDSPDHLVRLLVGMTRNKVMAQIRRQRAGKRDHRRAEPLDPVLCPAADHRPSPSQIVAGKDLLRELRRRLTDEERRLSELRAQGLGWAEIARELGGTPDGRRVQLVRAVQRVGAELGLEEHDVA